MSGVCCLDQCSEPVHAKDMCSTHYFRAYRQANREAIKQRDHASYVEKREEKLAWQKKWREDHPDYMREYAASNRERFRAKESRRRGRKRFGLTHMTDQERQDSIEWRKIITDRPCAYCGQRPNTMNDDHIKPISRGGTDHWFNIVRACGVCNSSKSARDVVEWLQSKRQSYGI